MLQRVISKVVERLSKVSPHLKFIEIRRSYSAKASLLNDFNFDYEYLVNPANRNEIEQNIKKRKGIGNLQQVIQLYSQLNAESDPLKKKIILESLNEEASKIPNRTHSDVMEYDQDPVKIKGSDSVEFKFSPKDFHNLAHNLRLIRTEELRWLTGYRSYYFIGDLAELEHALVRYTLSKLLKEKFQIVSVPDILPADIINKCGMRTDGERTQVYQLENAHGENLCLSGTAEMALASLYSNVVVDMNKLPVCVGSVSRCYRAELSTVKEEKGIYRVHNFTKVEMFGLSHPLRSEELFNKFVNLQEEIFRTLGLEFNILDMPMHELGAPAFRKYDIEAWLPGCEMYGEVSSCSNCTDFQSRRLNIKYRDEGENQYVHTVNATACAIPRTLMAIFETHQNEDGSIRIPKPLRPYLNGKEEIKKFLVPSVEEVTESRRQY